MPSLSFWVWVILAAAFLIAEIFTAGFFMLPFGIGAACAAILAFLGVAKWIQWVVFLGVSILCVALARAFAKKVTGEAGANTGIDRLLGQKGIVIEAIDNDKGAGRVRIVHEEWRAWSEGDEKYPADTKIEVLRVDGNHLVVRRTGE